MRASECAQELLERIAAGEQDLGIRPARSTEAAALSALAFRSKAHWGYGEDCLNKIRPMLTFTEADVVGSPVYVLEAASGPAGMYRITGSPPEGELEDLWVDPSFIGRGAGRPLLEHALRTAAELGFCSLRIESDPNAEGFYVARER